MKFVAFEKSDMRRATEMFVSVNLYTFTLNSAAAAEIIKIFGSHKYDLEIQLSEEPKAIGFKPVPATREKTNPQKAISSKELHEYLRPYRDKYGVHRIPLKKYEDVLYFELENKVDQP